jgi:hypothetical protein
MAQRMIDNTIDPQEYAALIGRVVANLQALEFLLGVFLYNKADPPHNPLPTGKSLCSLSVGDVVGENALTDFSPLGKLIDRYNRSIGASCPNLLVDRSIVELRDALAHGRLLKEAANEDLILVKFGNPSSGSTRVAYSHKLTRDWLKAQVGVTLGECKKIVQAPDAPVVGHWPFA